MAYWMMNDVNSTSSVGLLGSSALDFVVACVEDSDDFAGVFAAGSDAFAVCSGSFPAARASSCPASAEATRGRVLAQQVRSHCESRRPALPRASPSQWRTEARFRIRGEHHENAILTSGERSFTSSRHAFSLSFSVTPVCRNCICVGSESRLTVNVSSGTKRPASAAARVGPPSSGPLHEIEAACAARGGPRRCLL